MDVVYASLQSRIKAVVIDGIIAIALMYSVTEILNYFDDVPSSIRMYLFILLFILYEPILVSLFGSTAGHYFSDIKVKRVNNPNKNLIFPLALLRFILKYLLGWLSLLTVTSSQKRQAIHDSLVNSVEIID